MSVYLQSVLESRARRNHMWEKLIIIANEVQCTGTTRQGRRCSITSGSHMTDQHGRCVSEPLKRGGDKCLLRMDLFAVCPSGPLPDQDALAVFYLDFESTGLDVFNDQIVEIGVVEARSGAAFATTVQPRGPLVELGQNVHGISAAEIMHGPKFAVVFDRLRSFLNIVVDNALENSDSESDGHAEPDPPRLKFPSPQIVLVAHNGSSA